MPGRKNACIKCNVSSCRNLCDSENYCSLDTITIGTHENHARMNQCTDCLSYSNKNSAEQSYAVAKEKAELQGFFS